MALCLGMHGDLGAQIAVTGCGQTQRTDRAGEECGAQIVVHCAHPDLVGMAGLELVQFSAVWTLPAGKLDPLRHLVPPGLGSSAPFNQKMVDQILVRSALLAAPSQSRHAIRERNKRPINGFGK